MTTSDLTRVTVAEACRGYRGCRGWGWRGAGVGAPARGRECCAASQHVSEGTEIIREGTYGNDFYIIEEGEVRCSQQASPHADICRRLTASDFFGERALLYNEPRAATIRAGPGCPQLRAPASNRLA